MKKTFKKIKIPVLFTEQEYRFLIHLGQKNKLTPSEMMASVMRRHLKSRYRIPRKEWYYVFGK